MSFKDDLANIIAMENAEREAEERLAIHVHNQTVDYLEKKRAADEAVNSPAHYTDGGIETIDYIQAKLDDEQFYGYCIGNSLKYLSRAGKKGDWREDLKKARWYITRALGE